MPATHTTRLGLLVRHSTYEHRLARAEVDFALAAAAMEYEVQVYFMGFSIFQLVSQRATAGALLPTGYRAWAALPDLGEARIYAENKWLAYCKATGLELVMPVEALSEAAMRRSWRDCHHVVAV